MQDCTGLEESPIDWKAWLGEPTTKRHLPVSTKYIMDHLLFLEEEVLQKIKCRCEEEKLYVEGTGWPSLHAQMADDDDENGKALLDVAADIINLIDAQERTFNPVWVDSSKSDGNAHHSGYSLLWSMEEALKLEVDVGGDRTEEEKAKYTAAWWLRVHTVVESTSDQPTDPSEDSPQFMLVASMLRRILLSQPNRRFVFGLLLCGSALYVLLADRISIFYTETPINIHEDPLSFICAIAASSLLLPEKLGYDPTMKIWVPGKAPLQIWDKALHLEDVETCQYDLHWVIEMPLEREVPGGQRGQFVTACVLSLQRASTQMTIVWAVVNKEDMMLKGNENKIYVLKQCLSPSRTLVNVYSNDLFCSTEDAEAITADKIANFNPTAGVTQAPLHYLYAQVTPPTPGQASSPDPNVVMKKRKRSTNDEGPERVAPSSGCNSAAPRHWIQRRTLLNKLGWPLVRAATLSEYVRTIKDAVQDHQKWYLNGILHRDVSQGNILIFPTAANVRETKGGLIDLDNAKIADSYIQPIIFRESDASWNTEKRISRNRRNLKEEFEDMGIEVGPDVLLVFEKLMGHESMEHHSASSWVKFSRSMMDILGVEKLSLTDLGFHTKEISLPNFRDQDARLSHQRIATTIPFASPEVLNPERPLFSSDAPCSQDAVHELEGFLWVMTEHCLLRSGPGGEFRPELNPLSGHSFQSKEDRKLWYLYEALFGSPLTEVISGNKCIMLRSEHDYENCLLPNIHSYFEPLKPYLRRLFMLVRTAHCFGLDDIYTPFLRVLGQAEETLLKLQLPVTPASEKEFIRREKNLKVLQSFKDDHYDIDELDL